MVSDIERPKMNKAENGVNFKLIEKSIISFQTSNKQILSESSDKNKENVRKKPRVLIFLIGLLSITFSIAAGAGFINSTFIKTKALLNENCNERSCMNKLGLQCINSTCQCDSYSYYANECKLKQQYMEKCHKTSSTCDNNINLVCLDGVCTCDINSYWDGKTCQSKQLYNGKCQSSDIQCLATSILYCDASKMKCYCPSNRYIIIFTVTKKIDRLYNDFFMINCRFWDGYACWPKRSINEKCNDMSNCNTSLMLTCVNSTCKIYM